MNEKEGAEKPDKGKDNGTQASSEGDKKKKWKTGKSKTRQQPRPQHTQPQQNTNENPPAPKKEQSKNETQRKKSHSQQQQQQEGNVIEKSWKSNNWRTKRTQLEQVVRNNGINAFSSSEVQRILATHVGDLKRLVNSDIDETKDVHDNIGLLRALALSCEGGKSKNLTTILSAMKGSKFLCHHLPNVLRELQQAEQDSVSDLIKRRVIEDMIGLYLTFLRSLPSSYSDLPLDEVQRHFRKISIPDKSELEDKLDALKKERDVYIHDMRIKSVKPVKQENSKKPPNDFRELQICPTVHELTSGENSFIRANVKKGSYEDVEHYLDVQFRLYREDFITPLRDGIREIIQKIPRAERDQNIKTYDKVQIRNKQYSRNGVIYTLHFDTSRFKTTRWESSKRLLFGSFLCLSKDNFDNILFATVANRDPKDLSKGNLDISFVEGQNVHGIELRQNEQYIMAESPAYFEAYRHVLAALQNMREGSLPFLKYLVKCTKDVDAPAYLRDKEEIVCYDLTEALDVSDLDDANNVPLLKLEKWPDVSQLPLNDSQYEALRTALTKEFSVIQGPPGTGKTYVGLKIARCLLTNSHAWNPTQDSPILMVCFTNHALDQFLEGILDFLQKGIIRVGSRCKSERLEKCNLKSKVSIPYSQRSVNKASLAKQQQRIETIKEAYEENKTKKDIINIKRFEDSNSISAEHLDSLYYSNLYDSDCNTLKNVFELWICNKPNQRLQVDTNEVTPEFKPNCQVPSQIKRIQTDQDENEDLDDEEGWGEADQNLLPRKLHTDEDSENSDFDEYNVVDNDEVENDNYSKRLQSNPDIDHQTSLKFSLKSTGQPPQNDDHHLEYLSSHLEGNQSSEIDTFSNSRTPAHPRNVSSDLMGPQDYDEKEVGEGDIEGWTEVIRKKKLMDKSLRETKDTRENEELEEFPKQQLEFNFNLESCQENTSGSNEAMETIEIDQEWQHESRFLDGDEDRFKPIPTKLSSNFDGENRDKQTENENLETNTTKIMESDAVKVLQHPNVPTTDKSVRESMKGKRGEQTATERNETEESVSKTSHKGKEKRTRKKKQEKEKKNKNDKNRASHEELEKAKEKLKRLTKMKEEEIEDIKDIWELDHDARLRLYLTWVDILQDYNKHRIVQEEQTYDALCREVETTRNIEEEKILRKAKVIGMTTTGAARYHSMLQRIKPRIVIIEEAAEVLEAHIITSLARDTEQVILIGDHKQLRPKPTMYNLAIKYNLEISLFERMVLNNMDCKMLSIQHRMRPEIAKLTKCIYEERIDDHDSVTTLEDVRGMKTNLFFLDHQEVESFKGGLQSYTNIHEADMMVGLCRYLLQQEYEPSQITILTMYTGQLLEFKDKMPRREFQGVRVTAVDNFQGEENDIILLSLVRSNTTGNIGFLKESNRICVALSRARKGLYCIGNFGLLSKDRLWREICEDMKNKEALGDNIQLVCTNHGTSTSVSKVSDFTKVPFGGCGRPCDLRLPCGHLCPAKCHGSDPQHKNSKKCQKSCSSLCPQQKHRCQRRCHHPNECGVCLVKVPKLFPECGHEGVVACGMDPNTEICHKSKDKILACGHLKTVSCFLDRLGFTTQHVKIRKRMKKLRYVISKQMKSCGFEQNEEINKWKTELTILSEQLSAMLKNKSAYKIQLQCKEKCNSVCKRGIHHCERLCHYGKDCAPCKVEFESEILKCGHKMRATCDTNFDDLVCTELCARHLKCGHPCKKKCYVDCSSYKCQMQCPNHCENNHPCKEKCHFGSPCNNCMVIIDKVLPDCNHIARAECHINASTIPCLMPCKRKRTCGHPCENRCCEPCNTSKCKVKELKALLCGHEKLLPCHLEPFQHLCKEDVAKELPCGHKVKMACYVDPSQYLCNENVTKKFSCGHDIQMPCNVDPSKIKCTAIGGKKWSCGHTIHVPCETDVSQYSCKETTTKTLPCGHKIQLPCNIDASKQICREQVMKKLQCGHESQISCYNDPSMHLCTKIVELQLSCGHVHKTPCHLCQSPSTCSEVATKTLLCGHEQRMQCHSDSSKHICVKEVEKTLSCGHKKTMSCHMEVSHAICTEQVVKKLSCGHENQMSCNFNPNVFRCKSSVNRELKCGHAVKIPCSTNSEAIEAIVCKEMVRKQLPCQHFKEVPCSEETDDILCDALVERELLCKHLKEVPCHGKNIDIQCHKDVVKTLPCGHKKHLPCHQTPENPIVQCNTVVTRKLACGHGVEVPCNKDISSISCDKLITKGLLCGHEVKFPCNVENVDVNSISCHKCTTRKLSCEYEVEVSCSVDTNSFEYVTTKDFSCTREVDGPPCDVDDNKIPCAKLTTKSHTCGHEFETPSSEDVSTVSCHRITTKELLSDHEVEERPSNVERNTTPCDKLLTKGFSNSQEINVPCSSGTNAISCDKHTKTKNLPFALEVEKALNEYISCNELTKKHSQNSHNFETPALLNVNKKPTISNPEVKKLDSDHEFQMPYREDVSEIFYGRLTKKLLSCGHEVEVPCYMDVKTICCVNLTNKKLPCGHTKKLPCNADVNTVFCKVQMIKNLPCDHEVELPCHKDQSGYECQRPCERFLPCNHRCKQKCYETCDPNLCTAITTKTVPCPNKHKISVPCNVKVQDTYICNQQTAKILNCGHLWQGKCCESTLPFKCEIVETRTLSCPGKHQLNLPCYVDFKKIPCDKQCSKVLPCGHLCKLFCEEPCNRNKCNEYVPKTFEKCGHKKWLPCRIFSKAICLYKCQRLNGCGHPCGGHCGKPCNMQCLYEVRKELPCGHKLKMKCCDPVEYVQCVHPCTVKLDCGHVCTGKCSTCQEKGQHAQCPLPCGRSLLCSHRCHKACSGPCSPCQRECRGWCPHGRCQKTCSDTCEPCTMPCANMCPHQHCNNLCHEMCDRERCNKPCQKMLACGHPCMGLCGESCPALCYVCTPAKVAAVSPNKQRNKNLRFIQLRECGHVVEVNSMDAWMQKPLNTETNGQAQPRRCPRCSVPIYFSFRYANIVREALEMMTQSDYFKGDTRFAHPIEEHSLSGATSKPIYHTHRI